MYQTLNRNKIHLCDTYRNIFITLKQMVKTISFLLEKFANLFKRLNYFHISLIFLLHLTKF